jgi:hypothetical protein
MACRRFAIPIEQAISTGGRCPCGISSFFSSAIENCAVMAGDVMRIESIRIPSTMLLKAHEEVENVYREYCRRPDGAIRVVEFTHE